jgi:hypothetical protein
MHHSARKAGDAHKEIASTLGLVIARGEALHVEACVRAPIDEGSHRVLADMMSLLPEYVGRARKAD